MQPFLQWTSNNYYTFSYSECVFVALCIQYAMRMRHSHLWPVRLYNIFPHYLTHTARFSKEKKTTEHKMCFDFLYNFCLKKILILRRAERDTIKSVHWSSRKVPIILVRFKINLNFLDIFSKNTLISDFMKIRP